MSDLCLVAASAIERNLEDQQYFKCNVEFLRPKTIGASLLWLLESKKLSDVVFTFPNLPDRIEAHEFCLRARSPVFEQIFRTRKSGNIQGNEIEISEGTPHRFQQFLEFIYADKFEVDIAGALDLLPLSHKYKVFPLTEKCEALLETQIPMLDSVKVFEAARRYGRGELMDRAGQIMVKSFLELVRTGALTNAQEDALVYLFESDDLAVQEVGLFQFSLDWGRNQVGSSVDEQILRNNLKNLTAKNLHNTHRRYTNMAPEEFTKVVLPTGLLSPEDSLWVYSYFCGDGDKRRGLKTKFNTTLRKVEFTGTVTEFVDFYADHEDSLGWFPAFSKHSISFKAERMQVDGQVLPDYLLKKTVISAIHFWCPVGNSKSSEDHSVSLSLNISLMEYCGPVTEGNFTLKFQTKIFIRKQKIGSEPPVDLVSGRTYSIIVEDPSKLDLTGSFRKDPQAYWGTSIPNLNQEANINLEDVRLTLKGILRKTDYFAQQLSSKCEELSVIDGVQIGLV